jgi:hypothetical protein
MSQVNFAYADVVNDDGRLSLALSIFADRPHVRAELGEDAAAAGFQIGEVADIATLVEGEARPLGDVVLIDCPEVSGAMLAALARLDMRAAHCGAQLIVSTHIDALDDVFGCLDQSNPQILVDPTRADRVIALGRALALFPRLRLRELSEEDRLMLLRLTEQVGQIAERLDRLTADAGSAARGAFRFEMPKDDYFAGQETEAERLARAATPEMPDPRLVRRVIRRRQLRSRFFDGDLFADPAWDMLLDLTAARAERTRVSVTSLCIASGVPPTTALRWIGQMVEAGLFERVEDEADRRRAFVALTDKAAEAMARFFADLGPSPLPGMI